MTSGDVTIRFLKRCRAEKKVYLVGTPELCRQFRDENIILSDDADIVVTSFDTTLTYEKLNNACRLIRGGAEYLSTHPDFNCPVENGFIPDSGAISAFVTASTGVTPVYFGKPYAQTIDMISDSTDVCKNDMVIFGDRLYTDIALGKRHGVTAVLVLTGETSLSDVEQAKDDDKPDFIFPSLAEVHSLWRDILL
jgi:HAD superfamily hydrolase (TIGR01450 family)